MIVELTKQTNKALRWILKAAAKDQDRPILTGVNSNGSQVACDGFRIHAAQVPMDDGTWVFGKVPASAELVKAQPVYVDGAAYAPSYPDYHQIIPDAARDPEFEICVSARYLGEAIAAMKGKRGDGFVRLRFFGENSPLEVFGSLGTVKEKNAAGKDVDVDVPGYALIMPVYRADDDKAHNWRPTRPVKDGENA